MDNKVKNQIFAIRNTGETNMLDLPKIREIGLRERYHELLDFLDENKSEYVRFILYGDEE